MGIFNKLFGTSGTENDFSESWLMSASDEELNDEYEKRRLDCHGDITDEMDQLNAEMVRRMNEQYENEHPNAEPVYHEHGWYLSSDD